MQFKQLYIGRKILLEGGSRKSKEEEIEKESEIENCVTKKCIF